MLPLRRQTLSEGSDLVLWERFHSHGRCRAWPFRAMSAQRPALSSDPCRIEPDPRLVSDLRLGPLLSGPGAESGRRWAGPPGPLRNLRPCRTVRPPVPASEASAAAAAAPTAAGRGSALRARAALTAVAAPAACGGTRCSSAACGGTRCSSAGCGGVAAAAHAVVQAAQATATAHAPEAAQATATVVAAVVANAGRGRHAAEATAQAAAETAQAAAAAQGPSADHEGPAACPRDRQDGRPARKSSHRPGRTRVWAEPPSR
jgi:hypothetical protein